MTATFDIKMRVTARDPASRWSSPGWAAAFAAPRATSASTNRVQLEEVENGSTRVLLESDVALGGMLGSLGQKVVAKQATLVTESFARALEQALSAGGGEAQAQAASPSEDEASAPAYAPAAQAPASPRPSMAQIAIAGVVLMAIFLILRRVTSR